MTDRELLELAAKAAGLKIDKSASNGGPYKNTGFDLDGSAVLDWHNGKTWNPLVDDGDALRLAVKLGMSVRHEDHEVLVRAKDKPVHLDWVSESIVGDPYSATRRAIVRAAAEIGVRGATRPETQIQQPDA